MPPPWKDESNWPSGPLPDAVESIPLTLAENSGFDPVDCLAALRAKHGQGMKNYGLDIITGEPADMLAQGVVEPLKVKTQAIKSATEAATMVLASRRRHCCQEGRDDSQARAKPARLHHASDADASLLKDPGSRLSLPARILPVISRMTNFGWKAQNGRRYGYKF